MYVLEILTVAACKKDHTSVRVKWKAKSKRAVVRFQSSTIELVLHRNHDNQNSLSRERAQVVNQGWVNETVIVRQAASCRVDYHVNPHDFCDKNKSNATHNTRCILNPPNSLKLATQDGNSTRILESS